jgi:ABC-type transport system substrate-binding protein
MTMCGVLSLAVGCAKSANSPQAGAIDTNAILRVGVPMQVTTSFALDPRVSSGSTDGIWLFAMYSPLLTYTPSNGKYTPNLASSVTVINPTTVKVVLRSDAKFSNGEQITAADAKATLDTDKANQASGKADGLQSGLQAISSIDVNNRTTFTIHTSTPALSALYEILSGRESFIVPAGAGASQNTNPVTDGPFKFVSYTPGQKLTLTKSGTYFDASAVKLKGVEFLNLAEGTPQLNALEAGDINLTAGVDSGGLDPSDYAAISRNSSFDSMAVPTAFTYLQLCSAPGYIFNDTRVRQAVQYGTNQAAVSLAVFGSNKYAARQLWNPGSAFYNTSLAASQSYDPDKAKKLLQEAGVKSGAAVRMLLSTQDATSQPIALSLKQQWAQIGLNVQIAQTDDLPTQLLVPATNGGPGLPADMTSITWGRPASTKLSLLFTPGQNRDLCDFKDPALISLTKQIAALAPGAPQAVTLWKEASAEIWKTAVVIPLIESRQTPAWSKSVHGITADTGITDGAVSIRYDKLYMTKS